MHLHIISVGSNRQKYLMEGETDYLKRLGHYCSIELKSVKEEKIKQNRYSNQIRSIEGDRLIKRIPDKSVVVVLDKQGKQLDSEEMAVMIADWQNRAVRHVTFLIGGPLGLSECVFARADHVLSLSKMTFTHEMVRLILLEQIYRSFTILRGENYHK